MPLWAFFGLGFLELIVLGVIGTVFFVGAVTVAVVLLVSANKKKNEPMND
jgi:hypothetical protein